MAAAAILDLQLKMAQEHKNYHFIILVMPDLVEIDTLFTISAIWFRIYDLLCFFKMASAAILDFKVKGALHVEFYNSNVFLIPKLVEIDTQIVIFGHVVQEI